MPFIKVLMFLLLPYIVFAQNNKELVLANNTNNVSGINFQRNLSWLQLKEKAKEEGKYIFVDCYATWCLPCKRMDKEVYSDKNVGILANKEFISIKVQMDTSSNDSEEIKNWYHDAKVIQQSFSVRSFPTFLFFSPNGDIVHKDQGARNPDEFLSLLRTATDSNKQYYALCSKFLNGDADEVNLKYLANLAKRYNDVNMANAVAVKYFSDAPSYGYEEIYSEKSIEFVLSFSKLITSRNKYFEIFLLNGQKVDSIMGLIGLSESFVNYIITKEEIKPELEAARVSGRPNWKKCFLIINYKYGKNYAQKNIISSKVSWYASKNEWEKCIKYAILKAERYGFESSGPGMNVNINTLCWTIFEHSNKRNQLNKAIKWIKEVLKKDSTNPAYIDTYANLLYKTGRVVEAIKWEDKACKLAPNEEEYNSVYSKMKNGLPTWPSK